MPTTASNAQTPLEIAAPIAEWQANPAVTEILHAIVMAEYLSRAVTNLARQVTHSTATSNAQSCIGQMTNERVAGQWNRSFATERRASGAVGYLFDALTERRDLWIAHKAASEGFNQQVSPKEWFERIWAIGDEGDIATVDAVWEAYKAAIVPADQVLS